MMALVALTAYTVNHLIKQQFENQAALTLRTANAVFNGSQKVFVHNLQLRFHNLMNEPQYKAAMQTGHIPTLQDKFKNIPGEQDVDVVLFASNTGETLAKVKRDPALSLVEFETNSLTAVSRALKGE